DAQEQISDLLTALRRLQDVEVVVETRFVTLSDVCMKRLAGREKRNDGCPLGGVRTVTSLEDGLERVGSDFEAGSNQATPSAGAATKVWFLNADQTAQFLETVQGDRRTNVLQAPKLTVANGQASTIDLTDKQMFVTGITKTVVDGQVVLMPQTESIATGWKWSVQPVVSADRRHVQLKLLASQASVASPVAVYPVVTSVTPVQADGGKGEAVPFTQFIQQPKVTHQDIHTTLAIPDGGTAVLGGWKTQREVASEFGPPVLSNIPYVNRPFKNVGYSCETEHVLVLVTPRIV